MWRHNSKSILWQYYVTFTIWLSVLLATVAYTIDFFTNFIPNEASFSGTKNKAKNRGCCFMLTILINIRMDRVGQSYDCVLYIHELPTSWICWQVFCDVRVISSLWKRLTPRAIRSEVARVAWTAPLFYPKFDHVRMCKRINVCMMLKLTSLIPRPHPAFCAVRMLVVVFVYLQGEPGNEARSYHPQSDTSYTTQQT